MKEFDIILEQIGKIDADVLPKLKVDLGYSFAHRNLVLTALFQPSAKKIFSEIKKEFNSLSDFIVTFENLDSLRSAPTELNHLHGLAMLQLNLLFHQRFGK